MRLIDADKLIDYIEETYLKRLNEDHNVPFNLIHTLINEQPTAYDIDKVVEQLEKRSNEEGAEWVRLQRSEEVRQVSNTDIHSYASSCYDDAIEIVKGGGNE